MTNKTILGVLLAAGLYLLSTGISYSLFAQSPGGGAANVDNTSTDASGTDPASYDAIAFNQSLPKTESCPLNGVKYSKEQKKWWESHRPLGVMVENHTDSRPQAGLYAADTIYEAVAEGGITRFLAVFYCQDAGRVGPVRSARTYFIDMMSEYGNYPLYAHVGGANCDEQSGTGCLNGAKADALGQLREYGWHLYNDLNQFFSVKRELDYPVFKRIEGFNGRDVATEHTMYSNTNLLWKAGVERGLTNKDKDGNMWDENFVKYSFKDDAATAERGDTAQTIHVEYWDGYKDFFVDWTYDKEKNVYLRKNGGEDHIDKNTGNQLSAKNIIVLYMKESSANDGYENNLHLLYGTKGTGKAKVFMDGKEIEANWRKNDRTSRTIITVNGKEVVFDRGKLWFHILPIDGVVTVK